MLQLSDIAKMQKNKVSSDGAFLVLLDVMLKDGRVERFVRNNEDIYWNEHLYSAFGFTIGNVDENSNDELPSLDIAIPNDGYMMQAYLEEYLGGTGVRVTIRVVNSKTLDEPNPYFESTFAVIDTKIDAQWIRFTLGSDFPMTRRIPHRKYMKESCPFKFKGIECGYNGTDYDRCNSTFADCKLRGNTQRFGGEPGLQVGNYRGG